MSKQPPTQAPAQRELWPKWFPRVVQTLGLAIVLFEVAADKNSVEAFGVALTLIFGGTSARLADVGLSWYRESREGRPDA